MNDEEIQGQALRCPKCKQEAMFEIAATVWIKVAGRDSLTVIDEGDDREYGSEDACYCQACGHQARLGDFYKDEQE